MTIDDAILSLSNYHPITREIDEVFNIAIHCMKFTRDFMPLGATPERMTHALNLLNSFEYAMGNKNIKLTFSEVQHE